MAVKVITLDQLDTVVKRIKASIAERVPLSKVDFGNATLTYDAENEAIVINGSEYRKGDVVIKLPDEGRTFTLDSDKVAVKEVETQVLGDGSKVYALPYSSDQAKAASSNIITGGGVVLTTTYNNKGRRVLDCRNVESFDTTLVSGVYTTLLNVSKANISIASSPVYAVTEYWLDVTFVGDDRAETGLSFTVDEDGEVIWPQGEPELGEMWGKRVLVHIINGIGDWRIIPTESERDEDEDYGEE